MLLSPPIKYILQILFTFTPGVPIFGLSFLTWRLSPTSFLLAPLGLSFFLDVLPSPKKGSRSRTSLVVRSPPQGQYLRAKFISIPVFRPLLFSAGPQPLFLTAPFGRPRFLFVARNFLHPLVPRIVVRDYFFGLVGLFLFPLLHVYSPLSSKSSVSLRSSLSSRTPLPEHWCFFYLPPRLSRSTPPQSLSCFRWEGLTNVPCLFPPSPFSFLHFVDFSLYLPFRNECFFPFSATFPTPIPLLSTSS